MRKVLISIGLFLLAVVMANGQGVPVNGESIKSTAGQAASVRVCTKEAISTPCTILASIYADELLTIPKENPLATDAQGNYSYYAAPGVYKEQITGNGVTKTRMVTVAPEDAKLVHNTGDEAIAGTKTFNGKIEGYITDLAPEATTYFQRVFVKGAGYEHQAKGVGALRLDVSDDDSVAGDPTKKGILYGIVITIDPKVARDDVPNDDAAGIIVQNEGTQKATDAFYVGRGSQSPSLDWSTLFSSDAWASIGFHLAGYLDTYGIDLKDASWGTNAAPIRIPNDKGIVARNAANDADVNVVKLDSSGAVVLGNTGSTGASAKVQNSGGGHITISISSNATSEATIAFTNKLTLSGGPVVADSGVDANNAGIANAGAISGATTIELGGNDLATMLGTKAGISGTPTTNRAVCWKTATTLGYCSTAPDASGACTCN